MTEALRRAWAWAPLLMLGLAWEGVSHAGIVSAYALPPLSSVLSAWWALLIDPTFWPHVLASLSRSVSGLGLALVFGIALGVALAWWRWVDALLGPVVQLFYPLPKSALIPLTIIWFGIGDRSKVFLIFLGCLLPIATATYNGVRGVDRNLLWSASSLGAGRWSVILDVGVMGAVPDMLAGIRTALALSFVLLVSSELLISNEGLGFLIRSYGDGSQYPQMFACSLTVMAMGFMADQGFRRLAAHLLRWRG
jgi:ABC-type nitrate/sulfonate/bicarbonate transport system permease component